MPEYDLEAPERWKINLKVLEDMICFFKTGYASCGLGGGSGGLGLALAFVPAAAVGPGAGAAAGS